MERAIALSIENVASGGGPFGAVVVRDGEIIGEGVNRVTANHDPSAHAEVLAIRAGSWQLQNFDLSGCELYSSCEPCPMCMALVYWSRLNKIYYANRVADAARIGFDDAFIYRELALPPESRSLPQVQLMREEALKAFAAWERKSDKTEY